MKIIDILSEAKFRKPAVMFHGTSSKFLREILKQGLIPTTKKAVYDKESDTMVTGLSKKTLGGVYFSKSSRVARTSALYASNKFGGNQLIIIAQVAEQSSYADEDVISDTILDVFKEVMGNQYSEPSARKVINKLQDVDVHRALSNVFADRLHQALDEKGNIPKEWDGYSSAFNSVAAFFIDIDINNVPATDEYNKKLDYLESRGINHDDGRNEIRKVQDALTRRYRASVYNEPGEYEKFHALRITSPVRYSGSNKILAIIELGKKYEDPIKLHYGSKGVVLKYYKPSHEKTVGFWSGIAD